MFQQRCHGDADRDVQISFFNAETLLARSMLQAATRAAAEQVSAVATAPAIQPAAAAAVPGPLLRLRGVRLYLLFTTELLHALPAAALTRLELRDSYRWAHKVAVNSNAFIDGLARLTNLQQLHWELFKERLWARSECLAAVGQLLQLTKLYMHVVAPGSDLSLLQRQLQQLSMCIDHVWTMEVGEVISKSSTLIALGHLSALQQLHLQGLAAVGSQLPASLTGLTVNAAAPFIELTNSHSSSSSVQHLNLTDLRQLQQLELHQAWLGREKLQPLSTLKALTHLALDYGDEAYQHAGPEAPAWQHLSALKCMMLFQAAAWRWACRRW
jgi:hypothetical protein